MCRSDVKIGDMTISKGVEVDIPINDLHHNPKYWPDPHKFDPERYVHVLGIIIII